MRVLALTIQWPICIWTIAIPVESYHFLSCKIIGNLCPYNPCIPETIIYIQYATLTCQLSSTEPKIEQLVRGGGGGLVGLFVLWKRGGLGSKWGIGTKAAAKTPINTLIAAWQEQAVPAKDTLGHWRSGWGWKFPTGRHTVRLLSPGIILRNSKVK